MPSYSQYKRQLAVLDADDSEIESWITVRGNHIPIMKGQSKGDAVKAFIEKKKHNLVENHKSLIEATELEKKGYFRDKTPQHRAAITKSANEMGNEEKNLEELMQFGEKEANTAPTRKHYDPDFETVRKNAKANHYLYGGKYTQRSKQAAYKEWKHDTSSEENLRAANKWVNSELVAKKEENNANKIKLKDQDGNEVWVDIASLKPDPDTMPPTGTYREYLNKITRLTGMTIENAREKYGLYTEGQWQDLFAKHEKKLSKNKH